MTQSRVTQDVLESVDLPTPASRVSQDAIEVLVANQPLSRFTQDAVEVLVPNAPPVDLSGVTGQLWPRGGDALPGAVNTPGGPAGGVLGGTYPNPTFAADMATQSELDAVAASKANTSHTHAASDVTSGTMATARLGSGTASSATYLRGDQTWASPSVVTGGLIGSAAFNASSGSIASLVTTGIVSGVTRTGTGQYSIAFTAPQADANYIVSAIATDDNVFATMSYLGGTAANYTTSGFKVICVSNTATLRDPQVVRIGIFR